MLATSRFCAAIGLWLGLWSAALAAEPLEVGKYSCPNHLHVAGSIEADAESLSAALAGDPEVAWAGHPRAPMAAYRAVIRRRAEVALQHLGFAEPKVITRLDTGAEKVIVEVVEGPRFRSGKIRVTGASREATARIVASLTEMQPPEDAVLSISDKPDGKPESRWLDRDGKPAQLEVPKWNPGKPAPLDAATKSGLKRQIERSYADAGHYAVRYSFELVTNTDRGEADLAIDVKDEGPVAKVAEISIKGCEKNSRDEVLSFVGLEVGQPLSRPDAVQLEHKLRDSGRFIKQRVESKRQPTGDGLVVSIDLKEYVAAPRLSQPLSREEQALLRCRTWLLAMAEHGYELKYADPVDLQATDKDRRDGNQNVSPPIGEIALSQRGVLISFGRDPARRLTCVVAPDRIGCYLPADGGKLVIPVSGDAQLTANMQLAVNDNFGKKDQPEARPFVFQFGLGIKSLDEGETRAPLEVDLRFEPVFFVAVAHEYQPRFEWHDQVLTIQTAKGRIRIDGESGRLLEVVDRDEAGVERRMISEKNYIARRLAQLEAASGKNVFDATRPVSSILEYAGSQAMLDMVRDCGPAEGRSGSLEVVLSTLDGLRKSATENAFQPVDAWLEKWHTKHRESAKKRIVIPTDRDEWLENPVRGLAGYGLVITDSLFDRGTWPSTLGRLASSVVAGEMRFFPSDLAALAASEEMGPLGCLIMNSLSPDPALGTLFAQKGEGRLSAEAFRRDGELLTKALANIECLEPLVVVARVLTPEQAGTIGKELLGEDRGAAEMVRFLRTHESAKAATEALPEALEILWKEGLGAEIARALRKGRMAIARPPAPGRVK